MDDAVTFCEPAVATDAAATLEHNAITLFIPLVIRGHSVAYD